MATCVLPWALPRSERTAQDCQRELLEIGTSRMLLGLLQYSFFVSRRVPPEVRDFLAPYPDIVKATALALRRRVLVVMPAAHETVWDAINAVSLAYSDTERGTGVCHVATFSKHVNLGFNEGALMPDPLGLLVGSGKHIRHIAFREPQDADASWIDGYLHAALDVVGLTDAMGDRGTTVRIMKGQRRRPSW